MRDLSWRSTPGFKNTWLLSRRRTRREENHRLEEHVAGCPNCARDLAEARQADQVLAACSPRLCPMPGWKIAWFRACGKRAPGVFPAATLPTDCGGGGRGFAAGVSGTQSAH